jgi:hypothetical protein
MTAEVLVSSLVDQKTDIILEIANLPWGANASVEIVEQITEGNPQALSEQRLTADQSRLQFKTDGAFVLLLKLKEAK